MRIFHFWAMTVLLGLSATAAGQAVSVFELESPAFKNGQYLPVRHTCRGEDISPPLRWKSVPSGTRSLALICDDPDAPAGTWVHWVIFNISPSREGLEEGVGRAEILEGSIRQGKNDFGEIGYRGPCPPPGKPHRYRFSLYALDGELTLAAGCNLSELVSAMGGRTLGKAVLTGLFQR